MAVLLLPSVGEAHAERGAEQRRFDIVHAERVAAQHGMHPAAANQRGEAGDSAGVHHHRTGDHQDLLFLLDGVAHQRRGLPHGGFHLALRRDAVGHEGEGQAVALLGFGRDADAAQAHHDRVAGAQIAQAAAIGAAVPDHHHGVHALVFDLDPLLPVAHVGVVVGGGVEIFRRAAVALHGGQRGVARIHRGAAQIQKLVQQVLERGAVRRLHLQAQVGGFAVGAADAELLHFEAAVILHDLIEDVLHDVGVDQVAFRFDHFLKWHRKFYCRTGSRRLQACLLISPPFARDTRRYNPFHVATSISPPRGAVLSGRGSNAERTPGFSGEVVGLREVLPSRSHFRRRGLGRGAGEGDAEDSRCKERSGVHRSGG